LVIGTSLNICLWLCVLIDVTKMLVLNGTMQYKVHEWYLNGMNGLGY